MEIKNRKVNVFRTNIDPMIPPRPRNAFSKKELPNYEFELCPIGICVKCPIKAKEGEPQHLDFIVPYANIQSIQLLPEESKKVLDVKPPEEKKAA